MKQSYKQAKAHIGTLDSSIKQALDQALKNKIVERLWKKDPTLWSQDKTVGVGIQNMLGWLHLPEFMQDKIEAIQKFANEIKNSQFKKLVLLGMGGSSLAPEVFNQTFGTSSGFPKFSMLDSTDPEAVRAIHKNNDPNETLYIVASKSGSTVEPLRFYDYFFHQVEKIKGKEAGRHFVAITDSGSLLEKEAKDKQFLKTFINPSDIGGRYSALSFFGLVPAALMGVNLKELMEKTKQIYDLSKNDNELQNNPGVWLGCLLGAAAQKGRDKITFLVSKELFSLGLWLEQLIAESTGKHGKGVVPITDEPRLDPKEYGSDRIFISIKDQSSNDQNPDVFANELIQAGHPVVEIPVESTANLGAEYFRWEITTAVLGHFVGINPFDQPNVQMAKDLTKKVLEELKKSGQLPWPKSLLEGNGFSLSYSGEALKSIKSPSSVEEGIDAFLSLIKQQDYLGILPYLSPWDQLDKPFFELRKTIIKKTKNSIQFGYGPRYLHSTGQLHKGGPKSGVFIVIAREDTPDLAIPGAPYTFGQLVLAQCLGDVQALDQGNFRTLFIRFKGSPKTKIEELTKLIESLQKVRA